MKISQDPENEIRITDDSGVILLKFYECKDGYLVSFDKNKVQLEK